jgi:hypothetical protein
MIFDMEDIRASVGTGDVTLIEHEEVPGNRGTGLTLHIEVWDMTPAEQAFVQTALDLIKEKVITVEAHKETMNSTDHFHVINVADKKFILDRREPPF